MKTALDTSVLLAILKEEPDSEKWTERLEAAAIEGELVVCPVVFAEISAQFATLDPLLNFFRAFPIYYDDFTPESAHVAGRMFLRYRRSGGSREHLIPDFLIAAHAQEQANRLAALDRGYLRTYFPKLKLLPL